MNEKEYSGYDCYICKKQLNTNEVYGSIVPFSRTYCKKHRKMRK